MAACVQNPCPTPTQQPHNVASVTVLVHCCLEGIPVGRRQAGAAHIATASLLGLPLGTEQQACIGMLIECRLLQTARCCMGRHHATRGRAICRQACNEKRTYRNVDLGQGLKVQVHALLQHEGLLQSCHHVLHPDNAQSHACGQIRQAARTGYLIRYARPPVQDA